MCLNCRTQDAFADLFSLRPVIKSYLPEKYSLINEGWNSNVELYTGCCSTAEFLAEVKKYSCFPGSHIYFGMELVDPLSTVINAHRNLKNDEKYIYRQHILNCMQMGVKNLKHEHDYELGAHQKLVVTSVIGFYLKTIGLSFDGTAELVQYPENACEELFQQLIEKTMNAEPVHKLADKNSFDEIRQKLKLVLPVNKDDPEYKSILELLKTCGVPLAKLEFFEKCINWIEIIISEFKVFIDSHPELFLPREQNQDTFIPIVRVLESRNKRKLVLVHELLREMKAAKLDTSKLQDISAKPELWTEELETIEVLLGEEFNKITFVKSTITQNFRRAHFIPSFNGQFCFKTSDILQEIIKEMSSVHGHFQNLSDTHWSMLSPLFNELADRLESESNGCQLIDTKAAFEIKKWMLEETQKVFACRPKETKEVRLFRNNRFTVKDLKNELKRLGITESFASRPTTDMIDIAYKAHSVQNGVDVLSARHLHAVLELVQMSLVAEKFEKIWHIIHACGDCTSLVIKCIFRNGYTLASENQSEVDKEDEKTERKKEKKKRQAEKKRLEKEGNNVSQPETISKQNTETGEESNGLSSDLKIDTITKQPSTNLEADAKKSEELVAAPKNIPNSCSKCFRTSEHCEKAKNQLKEEKIKTKALKKEVTGLSESLVEKDEELTKRDETISKQAEEIRQLKEKLAAMETSLQQYAIKSAEQPSTSDQPEDGDDNLPLRFLAPTYKNSEFSVETRAKFNELLNIRDSRASLEHQAKKRANALSNKTKDHGIKKTVGLELRQLLNSHKSYFQVVENNIKWIQKHKNDHLDKLQVLPELAKFSDNFEKLYDEVVNEELSDKTCPVCIEEVTDLSETIKCKCKKRYHVHCAWDMDANGYKCYCEAKLPLDQ